VKNHLNNEKKVRVREETRKEEKKGYTPKAEDVELCCWPPEEKERPKSKEGVD
jgi:hypothetical protein